MNVLDAAGRDLKHAESDASPQATAISMPSNVCRTELASSTAC